MGESESGESERAGVLGQLRVTAVETASSLRSVFANRDLRRVQLALTGSMFGDWAYATAIIVWAFDAGGAKAVGIWGAIRLFVMAVAAPGLAQFADKLPRKRVMIAADLARLVTIVASAICISAGTPSGYIYVLATLTSILGCVFRPAQAAWMPSLADQPEQLTASNGVSSTIESLAMFIGPAIGAALLTATSVQTVFYIDAASFLWSAALVAGIHPHHTEDSTEPRPEATSDEADTSEDGALAELFAGFREIGRNPDLRYVGFLVCIQTIIAGASTVFWVVIAVKVLHTGPRGIGYINAVTGVGAVIGGFFAIARAARHRLTIDLTAGVILWSVPLLLIIASQTAAAVFVVAILIGFGNPLVDVNYATAIQRIAEDRVLGRVFGALEGALIATMAAGTAVAPFLIDSLGLRTTLAILALAVGAPALLLLPRARQIDHRLDEPDGLPLLRALPIFAPMTPTQLDGLARQLVRREVPAGTVIVATGEGAEEFFVIESGRVKVTRGRKVLRQEGPGEYFGEIALLRDVPRTATVKAVEDTVLLGLSRAHFLDAVTGSAESAQAIDEVVASRIRF